MATPPLFREPFSALPPDLRKEAQKNFERYLELSAQIAAETNSPVDEPAGTVMIKERSNDTLTT